MIKVNLYNQIPPPIIMLITAAIMWFISQITLNYKMSYMFNVPLVCFLVFIGMFSCIAGVISFKLAKTTTNPLKPETVSLLVTSGIYKFSRNPMYLGFVLLLLAWGVFLMSLFSLVGVCLFILYINHFQIKPEELVLKKMFGDEFKHYQSKVRRWL